MDKLYVKDLEIYAYHGVNIEEKNMGQRFLISVELDLDLRIAGITDNLNNTINYAELCQNIEIEFKKEKYDLIECCVEKIAKYILTNYSQVKKVKLLLKKPWAPIGKPLDYAAVEIERSWHKAYLGLGSNMGDKDSYIKQALTLLETTDTKLIRTSNFYTTKPVGYLDQDDFLNCAVEIETLLAPEELMTFLLNLEKDLKRERVIHWGPRTIDIDILLYDNIITSSEHVIIPHPRMQERLFVLTPLCDIAPYALHPLLNKRISDLEKELKA